MSDGLGVALRPGERVPWRGRPRGGLRLRPLDALLIPFSLLWVSIPLFTMMSGAAAGGGIVALVPVAFVAIGLYFLAGRFVWNALVRRGTRYALTDRRVVTRRAFPSWSVEEVPLHPALPIGLAGRDTVRLGEPRPIWSDPFGIWHEPHAGLIRLIPDAPKVAERIRAARDGIAP